MKPANDFYEKVFGVVAQIPCGKICSFGAIAKFLGVESGARMVGYALNNYQAYDLEFDVPAHRVLNRLGELTGREHFEGDTMRERLEQEGINFIEEFTVDIEKHFWDPQELIED